MCVVDACLSRSSAAAAGKHRRKTIDRKTLTPPNSTNRPHSLTSRERESPLREQAAQLARHEGQEEPTPADAEGTQQAHQGDDVSQRALLTALGGF